MSNYSQTTFFTPKDSLPTSNPAKTIFGAAYDVEFGNIAIAIASKYDSTTTSMAGPITITTGAGTTLTIQPPSTSVAALIVTSISGSPAATFNGSDIAFINVNSSVPTNRAIIQLQQGGTNEARIGVDGTQVLLSDSANSDLCIVSAGNSVRIGTTTGGTTALKITTGNVTINPPTSGNTLTTTGNNGNYGIAVFGNATTGGSNGLFIDAGTNSSDFAINCGNQAGSKGLFKVLGDGSFQLGNSGSVQVLSGSSTGSITIAQPTSGVALTMTGVAATRALIVSSPSDNQITIDCQTGGQFSTLAFTNNLTAKGQIFWDNTNGFLLVNAVGGEQIKLFPGGGATVGGAATSQGSGTLNVVSGLYINGNQLFFGVPASSNTTAAVTDVGKMINAAGSITIPNAVFSQGHALSIYNNTAASITITATITTMRLAGTTTTGSRTLAARGIATIWFESGTECIVGGPGVT
jgi:hypothetical protein